MPHLNTSKNIKYIGCISPQEVIIAVFLINKFQVACHISTTSSDSTQMTKVDTVYSNNYENNTVIKITCYT